LRPLDPKSSALAKLSHTPLGSKVGNQKAIPPTKQNSLTYASLLLIEPNDCYCSHVNSNYWFLHENSLREAKTNS
ncbi:MAG: hypothetical protein IJA32_15415, partial [Lachnospiraceae bacterium]|nr:hypothetical protein [Lachnospiraceae bacterium]